MAPATLSYLERFGKQPAFPTEQHRAATDAVTHFLDPEPQVQALILAGSCARGVAVPDSCVDLVVLVAPEHRAGAENDLRRRLDAFIAADPACRVLQAAVPWAGVEFDLCTGEFRPGYHGYTSGADDYELEIGNMLAWTAPLLLHGPRFDELQRAYLPYYGEELRRERLQMVVRYALNNLEHVAPYAARGLLFQAFKRLYHALEEYLQALFIQRRLYPIAYDKWVREQLVEVLGEPDLYRELTLILAVPELTPRRLADRARRLERLIAQLQP